MKIKSYVDRFLDVTMRFLKREFKFFEKRLEMITQTHHDTNTTPFTAKMLIRSF